MGRGRALGAALAGLALTLTPLVVASPAEAAPRRAAVQTPLAVTIDTLSPSVVPARGRIRLAGRVTNQDEVTWRAINVYAFASTTPMTSGDEIAAAALTPQTSDVGQRITDIGNFFTIDELAPGESKAFTFTVDRDLLPVTEPGVYWFGVHALGESDAGRDDLADGRSRTFLPLVPADTSTPVAIVVPLRAALTRTSDGRLQDVDRWLRTLSPEGRLRSLVDLAAASADRPVTWLVDPALIDAVRDLAAGNPARSIAANLDPADFPPDGPSDNEPSEGSATASSEPSASSAPAASSSESSPAEGAGSQTSEPDPSAQELSEDLDSQTREAAEAARGWLGRLAANVDTLDQVLLLPYGDPDLAGAGRHAPALIERAVARSLGATSSPAGTPAFAPPGGFVPVEGLRALPADVPVLMTDLALSTSGKPADVAGHRVVVTSSGAAAGGPAPGDRLGPVALRQRILAEAAVRALDTQDPGRPLVVQLPPNWIPSGFSNTFFSGLDVPWVDLDTVSAATDIGPTSVVEPGDVVYPESQRSREVTATSFRAAQALIEAGETLDDVLPGNDVVGPAVVDQALASTSYSSRERPDTARAATERSRSWVTGQLTKVSVAAPSAVTLSNVDGSFPVVVRNDLDEVVDISLSAVTDDSIVLVAPAQVRVPAGSASTVLIEVRRASVGVHEVTLFVTDPRGRRLGRSDDLAVRSAQVSDAIWLFIATGLGLLFFSIGVRLVRRLRSARRA